MSDSIDYHTVYRAVLTIKKRTRQKPLYGVLIYVLNNDADLSNLSIRQSHLLPGDDIATGSRGTPLNHTWGDQWGHAENKVLSVNIEV